MRTPLWRLSPPRRRFYLALVSIVVLAVAVPLGAAALRSEPVPTVDQDRLGPVVLVPGYGGSTRSLELMQFYLTGRDRDVTILDVPGDGTGDLREAAEALDDAVDDLLDDGAPSVDLVGYSAGGEIVRWYVDQLGGAAHTRRVVTLGSPNHGTDLAALAVGVAGGACPEACQQLAPDSDLLRELNRGDETPPGPQWTAIWTEDDQTVVPPSSGTLDGALAYSVQDLCPRLHLSHGDLPEAFATVTMVIAAIGTDDPARADADLACQRGVTITHP